MTGNRTMYRKRNQGQAMLEFVMMFVLFMGVLAMLSLFLYTFKEYGGRILDLVASEYP
jgi:Tfp pilus assembly protein PilV